MAAAAIDVAVIGGGPIGCALACALRDSGLHCLILEARPADAPSADARTLALSYGSRLVLERLDAWRAIEPLTAITSIHVSQRGGFGRTVLEASDVGLEALGYVAPFSATHRALAAQLPRDVELRRGVTVASIETGTGEVRMRCTAERAEFDLPARLAAVGDGGAGLAQSLGRAFVTRDYRQVAVVAMVRASSPHRGRAYERFTPDGPAALLPSGEEFALVWSCPTEASPRLLSLPDEAFLSELQAHFGDRAGRFVAVRARAAFPLSLRFARAPVGSRTVMLGNSAQMLHPIAGQGFNLGLRDAWELSRSIREYGADDPGSARVLERYRKARLPDRMAGIAATDVLTRLFSNDYGWLSPLRGAAIAALDLVPFAKRFLMRRMIFGSAL
jgi:2-octaprenyl-6-methoxyphenol hydroxylase